MTKQLTLGNFETLLDDTILARGKEYFATGHVLDIEADGDQFIAEVEGSDLYTVTVTLDEEGNIYETICDCPYDFGPYCKHQAAVLYALREQTTARATKRDPGKSKQDQLRAALQARTKDELITLIMSLAKEDRSLAKRLAFEYSENVAAEAREFMLSYIRRVSRAGMIPYEYTAEATRGVEIVLERAVDQQNPLHAFQLYEAVISVGMELLHMVDDAADAIVECVSTVIMNIEELAEDSTDTLAETDRRKLFDFIFAEACDTRYDRWDSWRQDLLHACVPFCDLPECRKQLEDYLAMTLDTMPYGERDHEVEVRKLVRMAIINRFDGDQASEAFIEQNLESPDFREMALDRAIQADDYAKVLEIAQAGIKADADRYGLVRRWDDYAYRAYKALGDTENIRSIARKHVLAGQFTLYADLRSTYADSEWPAALDGLLAEFESERFRSATYVKILIRENLQDKLLAHCRQNPEQIISLYSHFDQSYAAQVNDLFLTTLRAHAKLANSRSKYWRVCQELQTYRKACGAENAARLVQELQDTYRRRPAFLDELSRLR